MISSKTVTIISSVVGGTALLVLFALLTIWLYRWRFVEPVKDEEAARAHAAASDSDSDAYPDPSVATFGAGAPGVAQSNEKKAKHTSVSPPPLSSIWRGRQWVTVSRPKTPRTAISLKSSNPLSVSFASANPHGHHHHHKPTTATANPIASATPVVPKTPVIMGPPEKKTKGQRLSDMITKLKSDFMDVQL